MGPSAKKSSKKKASAGGGDDRGVLAGADIGHYCVIRLMAALGLASNLQPVPARIHAEAQEIRRGGRGPSLNAVPEAASLMEALGPDQLAREGS